MPSPVVVFQSVASRLTAENLDVLDELYTPDILFQDPAREVRGLPAVKEYYRSLYVGVKTIRFDFDDLIEQPGAAALPWVMTLEHKTFRPGQSVSVPGSSVIRWREGQRVHYHRDYFDLGALLYERVPVLGGIVRSIRARL